MTVQLLATSFDPWQALSTYQQQHPALAGKHGAVSVFVGSMRDFNLGDNVNAMYLEHYPGMTEQQLQEICDQAAAQWVLLDTLILHRIGDILPNETIVLTAAWASHRGDAFDACRFIMEALKTRAPFWKKETLTSGEQRLVSENTQGYA